jgi:hypothetical protein
MAEHTLSDDTSDRGQFSVAIFYDEGTHDYIVRFVSAEQAFIAFRNCVAVAEHPRAKHPPVRIIVTNGGDDTMAMWEVGEGLTYPDPDTPLS